MADNQISPTRSKATWKPRVFSKSLPFFSCAGGGIALGIDDGGAIAWSDTSRAPEALLPYQFIDINDTADCTCSKQSAILHDLLLTTPLTLDSQAEKQPEEGDTSGAFTEDSDATNKAGKAPIKVDIRFVGGFDTNALEVRWTEHTDISCRWFALKTFSGLQLRYIMPHQKQPIIFAFAQDDAYAYCDKSPCEDCAFHCKRGFELYAGLADGSIATLPLHNPS